MTTTTTSPFTLTKSRASTIYATGRKHTRFDGWRVTLKATKPRRLASGQLAYGTGTLRSPRGDVDGYPLPEPPTADNALSLAERVAHVLDI